MFLLASSDIRSVVDLTSTPLVTYRIGSVSDGASLQVNCPCELSSVVTDSRVLISGSGIPLSLLL